MIRGCLANESPFLIIQESAQRSKVKLDWLTFRDRAHPTYNWESTLLLDDVPIVRARGKNLKSSKTAAVEAALKDVKIKSSNHHHGSNGIKYEEVPVTQREWNR